MGFHQYDVFKRISDLRDRFEKGQSLNCTDIASLYGISSKTANRYLDLLRKHFRMELTYDAKTKSFSLIS